jgi:BCD family chlorophyll transporter-like MFS transporter
METPGAAGLGWLGIVRLGLVQTCLGAIVVMMTSTINRVMIVELLLPAIAPGLLMALHHAVQILRPAWGYRADIGGRRTPWIIGGMGLLALGGFGAAVATALMSTQLVAGLALAVFAFLLIGLGVGAAGTSVLTMLASCVAPRRRAAAATIVWVMMIFGFAITAPLAGHFLDPFSNERLILVTGGVCAIAFCLSCLSVWGVEKQVADVAAAAARNHAARSTKPPFREAIGQIWNEPAARRFTIFIFVSMLAYSAQELLIEPYAGLVFSMTPGATTKLAGVQHGGVLVGMLTVALLASLAGIGSLVAWTVGGCVASAISLVAVAAGAFAGPDFPLRAAVFALGVSNGAFAVSAIGSMMSLAGSGAASREGTRMGLWGASQAIAFGLGGFLGTAAVDIARHLLSDSSLAYASVFICEAVLFLASAILAGRLTNTSARAEASADMAAKNDPLAAGT